MMKLKKLFTVITLSITLTASMAAATSFTGLAGGKINYSSNDKSSEYDPNLKLQAFFAGQFNLSPNLWSHMEFSIDTDDLINTSLFDATPSLFQIDEISLIARFINPTSANYFSAYMGTYDSIGSDVFLRRYFGCEPIASKITETWLGTAGSILYPHFGIGVSDVFKLYNSPWAFGGYIYINHEDAKYFVLNTDFRAACVYRYFSCDFACGLGAPLGDKYQGEDIIIAIDKLYWHAGTTMLIGNNYTTSLFLQGGIFNASFTAASQNLIVGADDIYLLFEPRFVKGNSHFNITLYSIPKNTVKKMLFVDDTLGADINLYVDSLLAGTHSITIGTHLGVSFTDKSFLDIPNFTSITSNGFNVNITPYFSTDFLNGQLHTQAKIEFMQFITGTWYNAFSADIGYTCKL